MSDTITIVKPPADRKRRSFTIGRSFTIAGSVALAVVLFLAPVYLDQFWLQTAFVIAGAAVGALGLNILIGTAGQLSFAHPFFLGVGATTYTWLSADSETSGSLSAVGMPTGLALVCSVLAAGVLGYVFSPLASRLRGIYLGVASIGFIFLGQHILDNWTSLSGGYNGRSTTDLSLFGFDFADGGSLAVLGVPFGRAERLWYFGILAVVLAAWLAKNIVRSRPGRALAAVRDSEVLAAVYGVDVPRYKRGAFVISSMYAGFAGVMIALSIGSVAPGAFDLALAFSYLSMIVLGGLGSVAGAVIGAVFVAGLPLILQQYGAGLPFISEVGADDGISASSLARYVFGIGIILVMLFEPFGLIGLGRRVKRVVRLAARNNNPLTKN